MLPPEHIPGRLQIVVELGSVRRFEQYQYALMNRAKRRTLPRWLEALPEGIIIRLQSAPVQTVRALAPGRNQQSRYIQTLQAPFCHLQPG